MPYEGEFAGYRALQRLADAERVKQLLSRARVSTATENVPTTVLNQAPAVGGPLPEFVVAIDGSQAEVDVQNGYPGAKVGYLSVASVLLDLAAIETLDNRRPVNPVEFRKTEQAATIDAALPGSNVVTRTHTSARVAFPNALAPIVSAHAQAAIPLHLGAKVLEQLAKALMDNS